MPGAARLTDFCTGHGCFASRPNITASEDVFVNDRGAHRMGDLWNTHTCSTTHGGLTITGSETVFVNDMPKARINDLISCGSRILTGSDDVFVEDAGGESGGIPSKSTPATPTPTTAPSPTPAPPVIPQPSGNIIIQSLLTEGSINYVFDGDKNGSPLGSIQALALPNYTSDGRLVSAAIYNFTDYIVYTPSTLLIEVAFSPVPGDFTYYKTEAASYTFEGQTFYPGGGIIGPVGTFARAPQAGLDACAIPPGEQWYLNWRVLSGRPIDDPYNVGQVLVWHRQY